MKLPAIFSFSPCCRVVLAGPGAFSICCSHSFNSVPTTTIGEKTRPSNLIQQVQIFFCKKKIKKSCSPSSFFCSKVNWLLVLLHQKNCPLLHARFKTRETVFQSVHFYRHFSTSGEKKAQSRSCILCRLSTYEIFFCPHLTTIMHQHLVCLGGFHE